MTLSRRDLELGRMRDLYRTASDGAGALDDEALSISLAATLEAVKRGTKYLKVLGSFPTER